MIIGGLPEVLLTVKNNQFIANAGIDRTNSGGSDYVTLWPENPYASAKLIRKELMNEYSLKHLGVLISDSHVSPMRQGVIGSAIGIAGIKPVEDLRGRTDLFGYTIHFAKRAIADQVVTAAHLVMGECDEQTPFVIVKGVKAEFTNQEIKPDEVHMPFNKCLFTNTLKEYWQS